MILFFGIRPGKTKVIRMENIKCPYCNESKTLIAESTPNFFHLFWIPLFRVSTTQLVSCQYCKRAYYKEEFTKDMHTAIDQLNN